MEITTHARTQPQTTSEGLIRAIGPWALGANAVNNTIGAGIFVLPALVAGILGPSAVAAYVICGIAMALVLMLKLTADTGQAVLPGRKKEENP